MAGTIKITPEELRSAAGFLKDKLDAMTSEANQLKARIDTVTSNWEGAAQSAFVAEFTDKMWPVLSKNLPELITGIQGQLNATAKTMEDTDAAIASKIK
ncbi:WXG100 family type VII secretion target [Anaerocolumna jejuensis DSM 15929]|uniref:ESAT-6-like protein n=1 Tax=Anaerocolumna jejuensis DSM 15929 TaxID=1121322 RepID=A0A1M6UM54_9FIRM|nr:WXG100 family type VII secretion target [Anaerocolumna jejuensis]SHK70239.1 WXG100 family type VII secretion target [Anaerocolumna jejuensis DSM 15929]